MLRKTLLSMIPVLSLTTPVFAVDDDIVGRAGGMDVSMKEIRARIDLLPETDRATLTKDPAQLTQFVRGYLADRVLLREAHDTGFDQKTPIKARLDQAHDALLMELYLQSVTHVPDTYPTEAEVRAAYDANKSALIAPRRYQLAQIFIAAPKIDQTKDDKTKDEKTSARLDELMKKLQGKSGDFEVLAREYSDAKAEAAKGGEIGWLAEPSLMPEIRQAVSGLTKGATTAPIRLNDGWHILHILDIREAGSEPLPFTEVKGPLAEQMRRQRLTNERQTYLTHLLKQKVPVVNELALTKLAPTLK
ncbi:peptidylprolyl isomerase [Beijerinckia indica]|uniref:Parvulin-like PPIase n=1 Tax=Beijerinckia indica subsp. indica (strain ATCC 9039 / DSM 1715 / NCIMB 8712) TaxID=395963 RepID=B2IBK0_BEII9|nr:peptidylprolyl isomerase [Beijerinckia indica]ACB96626.1 PpiC-type peptidyl-prolyl cis-trans isomerase [Beijerinckia indica subsp. indica ATCC 9039]